MRALRSPSKTVPCLLAAVLACARAAADEAGERALHAQIDAARRHVREVEVAVELEKRFYPPAETWDEDVATLMQRARAAGLADVRVTPGSAAPILLDDGRPSPLELRRLTLAGQAEYGAVHLFLSFLARTPRRVDLEKVRLAAAPEGTVGYSLQLGVPVFTGASAPLPPPAPPTSAGARTPEEAYASAREAFLRTHLAALSARAAQLEALRRVFALYEKRAERARAFAALAQLDRANDELDFALTEVRLEDGITVEGVAVGAAARAAVGPALAAAGLAVRDVPFSRQGPCHRFSITAPVPAPEVEFAGAPGNGPFDATTAAACAAPEGRARGRIAARGTDAKGLTLRLRGVEVPDLFRVLHTVTPLGFVVDGDVDGRVDVDYERASLDEAFGAMKAAGIVGQVGALIRVSNSVSGVAVEPPKSDHTGHPVSLDLKDADIRDLFAMFGMISGLRFEVPAGVDRRMSVFAQEQPWDRVVDAVTDSAGLRYRIEGDRVLLEEKSPRRPVARAPAAGRHPREARKVAVEDLQPAGAALVDGTWQAYAYGPGRVLWTLSPGARFLDGEVNAVTASAVTFDAGGKVVEVKLP
jgi:hypothetical protein